MANQNKPIIVPWDFSELSEFAMQHAQKLAKAISADIILVHIVKKESEIEDATKKLEVSTTEQERKYGLKPKFVVREGTIFTAISEVIAENDASFAVMGTHGVKGMQKFTGSWALKVIVDSKAPFIVVQAPPSETGQFDHVIFPVDFKFTEKEKLIWADYLSKISTPKFHVCYLNSADSGIRKKVQSNAVFAQKYLSERGIDFEVVKLEGKGSLADEAVTYAKEIGASMILISTTKNISFQDYVLGADEQKIIANKEKIPVMCVNPREDLTKTAGLT